MLSARDNLERMQIPTLPDDDTKYIIEVTFDGTVGKTYTYYWAHPLPPVSGSKVRVVSPFSGGTDVTVVKVHKIERPFSYGTGPKKYACTMAQYRVWMRDAAIEAKKDAYAAASAQEPVTLETKATGNSVNARPSAREFFDSNVQCVYYSKPHPDHQQETNAMNSPKIETITFVNGTDVNNMSDDQLIALVKDIDKNIAVLKELGELPKRLAKRMETLEADRKKLFELLDRDAA